jgi:ATP-dependent DNA ligase
MAQNRPERPGPRLASVILPRAIEPMLARPSSALPAGDDWLYEPKLDGFRALVHSDGRRTHIDSRNGKELDSYFPGLVSGLPAALGAPGVLDEIVIDNQSGLNFEGLQARLSRGRDCLPWLGATYVAFDLLAWGISLIDRAFVERRTLLEKHIYSSNLLTVTPKPRTVMRRIPGSHSMLAASRASLPSEGISPTVLANGRWSRYVGRDRSIVWWEATFPTHQVCRPCPWTLRLMRHPPPRWQYQRASCWSADGSREQASKALRKGEFW